MDKRKVEDRLQRLKDDIMLGKIAEPYGAVGILKSGDEFSFRSMTDGRIVNEIMEDKGFTAQALHTGDFSGQYWVRLSCNPDLPGFSSDCKLVAEIDTQRDLEDFEIEMLDNINKNLTNELCEQNHYPILCKKVVSLGIMDRMGDGITKALREAVRSELTEYFDHVEFKKGTRTLEEFS